MRLRTQAVPGRSAPYRQKTGLPGQMGGLLWQEREPPAHIFGIFAFTGNTGSCSPLAAEITSMTRCDMKVRDAMTPDVQLCTPNDTLKDAAEAMGALGIGLLPVADNDRLVGMISDRDIAVRGVGMGRGPESRVG